MTRKEHLLVCLNEECAEIQQAIDKALRFGMHNGYPKSGSTNEEDIVRECNDLLAVIELLQENGIISNVGSSSQIQAKKDKVNIYIEYSKSLGLIKE